MPQVLRAASTFWVVANHQTVALTEVPYTDHPELKIDEHESTQMPFRYVKTEDGEPIMPKVRHACVASCPPMALC